MKKFTMLLLAIILSVGILGASSDELGDLQLLNNASVRVYVWAGYPGNWALSRADNLRVSFEHRLHGGHNFTDRVTDYTHHGYYQYPYSTSHLSSINFPTVRASGNIGNVNANATVAHTPQLTVIHLYFNTGMPIDPH